MRLTKAIKEKLAELCRIGISRGSHDSQADGMCLMEATAWLAGERHSDAPVCACPTFTRYGIRLNDAYWPTDKDRTEALCDLPALLLNTRTHDVELMRKRAYALTDGAIRRVLPLMLDAIKRPDDAKRLRESRQVRRSSDE